jgi:hypothetical protein
MAAVFIVGVIVAYGVGGWLRGRRTLQLVAWTAVGFLPFVPAPEHAIFSFGGRPGDTNGFEYSAIDLIALTLLFAQKRLALRLPYPIRMAAYLVVALVATTQGDWPLGSLGYVWKLCRMYFLCAVVFGATADRQVAESILRGMLSGVLYEAVWVTWQHFGLGIRQAMGTFAHQNTLGSIVNL